MQQCHEKELVEGHVSSRSAGVKPSDIARDVFGFVILNQEAHRRWSRSAHQIRLHEKVAEGGGWGGYLWARNIENLEWYREEGYFEGLCWVSQQKTILQEKLPSVAGSFKELERDLPRTFPNHALEDGLRDTCRQIVQAYILRNRQVGYCQGMNYIAAILGRVTTIEKAFWLFTYIVEVIVPDYYRGLQGVLVDLYVLETMLDRLEPTLWEHLNKVGMTSGVAFTQYLVCLFSLGMPPEAVLQLWQVIFKSLNPRVKLLRLTCSLMRLLKADLLSAPDLDTAVAVFAEGASSLYNAQRLVDVSSVTEESLSDDWIVKVREEYVAETGCEVQTHLEKLAFVENAAMIRTLFDKVKTAWGRGTDDVITRRELQLLIDETEVDEEVEEKFEWETKEVNFREVVLTLILLQESERESNVKPESVGEVEGDDPHMASLPSRVSLALSTTNDKDEEEWEDEAEEAGVPETMRPLPIPDTQVLECFLCEREFKWFRRRHHCRACGKVVCNTCSPSRTIIPFLGYDTPVRICRNCETHVTSCVRLGGVSSPLSLDTDSFDDMGQVEI